MKARYVIAIALVVGVVWFVGSMRLVDRITDDGQRKDSIADAPSAGTHQQRTQEGMLSGIVTRVVDGDTIEIEGAGKVRLIGIDTPETVHPQKPVERMGKEATAATTVLALGKAVRLETDMQERDKYGRLLAYVWLPGGAMLNAELVRLGYAKVSTYPPNVKYQNRFLVLQREAVAAKRGLWAPEPEVVAKPAPRPRIAPTPAAAPAPVVPKQEPMVHITRTGAKYHAAGCRYLARSDIPISKKDAIARGYTPCKVCRP